MDLWQRRAALEPGSNPDRNIDYVSSLTNTLSVLDGTVTVILRYVPDTSTIAPAAFAAYLKTLESIDWPSHENLATTILQDISNELVPRWVQVVTRHADGSDMAEHKILVEDRQPQWSNPDLLAHLDPI